jgi:protein subunit release factor A
VGSNPTRLSISLPVATLEPVTTSPNVNENLRARAGGSRKIDMDTILVEIRAAEGGADAKLLVHEQLKVYVKFMALERL